jgi:predicted nucleotide-binding protein
VNEKQRQRLNHYVEQADRLEDTVEVRRWWMRVAMFLREVYGADVSDQFTSLASENEFDELALKRGYLEGLLAKLEDEASSQARMSTQLAVGNVAGTATTREVFVVHGHDGEAKETVARFLTKLDLEPIILHEQANQGRTIIEKFETSSTHVAFAVVLLTPDDLGCAATASKDDLHPRARQNVILELGYFMGRLGRTRVCALYKGGVELPSDFQGVVYIEFDSAGAWKTQLAQELVEAKLTINLEGLINK